ncbi:MAG: acetylxylan esterase [Oscillospiraceae bacterium]|nr:acetylxylan esterase [Oscillospiraceae bacterium]
MDTREFTLEAFDAYERRFAEARAARPLTKPWLAEDRAEILAGVKRMLRFDEALVPQISQPETVCETDCGGFTVTEYRYCTWEHVCGAATLYLPHGGEPKPLVFVCCGHGAQGRQTPTYAAMGRRLAELGMAAIVIDNLGQGDRNPYPEFKNRGHWLAVAPFACGLTLQGLIVAETLALIRHMKNDPRFDPDRFAACGNSGGGTLTMFLAALAPELSVLASSGYPSELSYVLQKEKAHCACNLLCGAAHGPEMWEIYSLFAPKPLLLSAGKSDKLFAPESVLRCGRKVRTCYAMAGAEDSFEFKRTDTGHSWEAEDVSVISDFLSRRLLGKEAAPIDAFPSQCTQSVPMPSDAIDAETLAQRLTGVHVPEGTALEDVFPPMLAGKPLTAAQLEGEKTMRIFAQYEFTLQE